MQINLVWSADTSAMPSTEIAAIEYAASFLDNWISSPISLNIQVGYNEVGGQAMDDVGEGRFNYIQESYSTLAPLLSADNGGAQLPASDPTNGQGVYVSNAEAKALGLMPANATSIDGYVGFAPDSGFNFDPFNRAQPDMYDFTGIAIHELTEAMGRRSDGFSPTGTMDVLDLYRYDFAPAGGLPGSLGSNGTTNYFSTDGGATDLGNFNTASDADPGDWNLNGPDIDVFRTGVPLDVINPLTGRDELLMAALGFTEGPGAGLGLPLVIQTDTNSFGSTSLTEASTEYFLYNATGFGPALQFGGAVALAGEFGTWVPIGAVQTATGYDIAWEIPGANTYGFWSTDSNGNYTGNLTGSLSGTSLTLEQFELTFNQDLNGDGVIGPPTVVIQTDTNSFGSTTLAQAGNEFLIRTAASDPVLQYNGAAATAGDEFGPWVPIGAVQTATGYDIAWEIPGANTYGFWSTDSNGNYTGNLTGGLSGTDYALQSMETTFHQDLNGDGTIGLTKTAIQTDTSAFGSTSLTEVANEYFLYNGAGSGPALTYAGAAATAGDEFGSWVPIGAVQTATGYDIAWEIPGANTYGFWSTDSNGNYTGNLTGGLSGTDYALQSMETTFHQDLNGDGTIGLTKTAIQTDTSAFGSTSLTEVANEYFLYNGAGSGPALTYAGAAATAGDEFGSWVPIGAVQTATGYDIAWEIPGANTYGFWSTDSNGNYTGNLTGSLSGTSLTLEQFELTFNQDLNGDGVIGIYAAPGTALQLNQSLAGPSGSTTIGTGATLELQASDSATVTFQGSTGTLQLDDAPTFSGQIFNFTGNGSLSGSDQVDLTNINYNSVHDSYTNGVLTVTDGSNTAELSFSGSYTLANFDFASDGSGGTTVYDPPVPTPSSQNTTSPNATSTDPSGSATIGTGATLELAAANVEAVTFTGSAGTLILDGSASAGQAFSFTGAVSGFAGQDAIDLPGIAFDAQTTLGYSPNSNNTGGALSFTDGTHSAKIALLGNYMASNFVMENDAHGGTMVVAETSHTGNQSMLANPQHT